MTDQYSSLSDHFKIVELTQPLYPNAPTWDGSCAFCLETTEIYNQMFRVQEIKLPKGGVGTHMDAPSHRFQKGLSIANIPLEQLVVPACVIDVSARAEADYEVSTQDVKEYEKIFGMILKNSLVIANTGWSRFWVDSVAYRNRDTDGRMHFPAFSAQAVELLLKRNIAGIAIDTLSPDCADVNFTVHKLILGANKYIIENIADCSELSPRGSYVIALPLLAENLTESPTRIIGLVPLKQGQ